MHLVRVELTSSGRPVLENDEFERSILDKVDLDLLRGFPDYTPEKFKGGDVILTTKRLIWRGGHSQPGVAWGLPVSAVQRVRKESGFSLRMNVKLEVTVGVDAGGRPVEGSVTTEKLTLKCKGDYPDNLKDQLEYLMATRPWAQSQSLPPSTTSQTSPSTVPPTPSTSGYPSPYPGPTYSPQLPQASPLVAGRQQQQLYQAPGYQSTAATPSPAPDTPDTVLVRQLRDMGFGKNRAARAVMATANNGLQPALDYLLAFGNQPGMDDPLPPPRPVPAPVPAQTPSYPPITSQPPPSSAAPWAPQGGYNTGQHPITHHNPLLGPQPGYGPAQYTAVQPTASTSVLSSHMGVAGLLKRQEQKTADAAKSLETAFQDLGALMTMAQQMVALAERFRGVMTGPAGGDGSDGGDLVDVATQQDLISLGITSPVTKESAGARYHQELARQLADFLTGPPGKELTGPLARNGGMLPLPDIYCLFNRARGSELVSPDDLTQAIQLFSSLRIPLAMRRFSSGLIVVQSAAHTDTQVASRIATLSSPPASEEPPPAGCVPGLGVPLTASDVARAMGVPLVIATEHLATAEQLGTVCRDDGPEGLRFFRNFFAEAAPLVV